MQRIVVMGTHGAGKTTLCYQLAAYLKQQQYNVKVINETVRQCPFPINEDADNNTEMWVIHKHIVEELDAKAEGYDAIVSDRGVLDGIAYWAERNPTCKDFKLLEKTSLQWMDKYDAIFLVEPSSDTDIFAVDAVRATSIEYRNRIRDLFRIYIKKLSQHAQNRIIKVNSDDIFKGFQLPEKINKVMDDAYEKKIISKP